jgi:hypothetical protein
LRLNLIQNALTDLNNKLRKNKVRIINGSVMRWAGHVARMGKRRGLHRGLVGKPEGKSLLGERGIDVKIILRWIFMKWDVGIWTGSSWLRIGTRGGRL